MAEVLVLVDHVDGAVRKTTHELLTIARRLGEPSAVFIGDGLDAAAPVLAEYGAARVYVVPAGEVTDHLVAPRAEVLAQLVQQTSPAAVLLPATFDGKEVAGRLAVRTGSGLVTDAIDVRAEDGQVLTTQSAFAGSYTVRSRVTRGTPVVTVKPNAATPEPAPAAAEQVDVQVAVSEVARPPASWRPAGLTQVVDGRPDRDQLCRPAAQGSSPCSRHLNCGFVRF